MPLFGILHLSLVAAIAATCAALCRLCRRSRGAARRVRLALACGLAVNEIVWWIFRYSHEGLGWANLPLQLCDLGVWFSVAACLTLAPLVVEFDYFAGLAGAAMALLTPDLWSPWPSYPAIYFFVAHGGIVAACTVLVFGGIAPLRRGALWRAYGMLLLYAAFLGGFNAAFHTNYMYLCQKPRNASLLNALGPWPVYLLPAAGVGLAIFGLLRAVAPQSAPPHAAA